MEERFRRLKARADRPGDAEKTWEAFQAEQSAEAESMIDEIGKEADIYLDNSGTIEELRSQVRGFMNTGEEFNVCWLAVKDAIIYKNKPKSA
jgi:dephospho-CoA kinase